VAARRAVRATSNHHGGGPRPLADPVVGELAAQETSPVGDVPWGSASLVPGREHPARPGRGSAVSEAASRKRRSPAAGRPLIVVVANAHRYPAGVRAVVSELTAARPDTGAAEMGLPLWSHRAVHFWHLQADGRANAQPRRNPGLVRLSGGSRDHPETARH